MFRNSLINNFLKSCKCYVRHENDKLLKYMYSEMGLLCLYMIQVKSDQVIFILSRFSILQQGNTSSKELFLPTL